MSQPTTLKACLRIAASSLLLILVGCSGSHSRAAHTPGRAFRFSYHATIAQLPATASQVRIWVPLAKTRDNQQIVSRQIRTDHPYEIHEEPTYGNDILAMTLASPIPSQVTIDVDYDAIVHSERRLARGHAVKSEEAVAAADELTLALRNEPFMVVNDAVTKLAHEATAGQRDELAKARALYDYVIQHMAYDKNTPGWGQGDTLRACQLGKGNCTDFHSLFISLARSVGIPARFVIGAPVPPGAGGEVPGYHCWAEFYTQAYGWVPVDASEAWKHPEMRDYYFGTLDPNRILLSVGRNLQLVPPQAGGPVNIFVYPYVEVDGQPFERHIETWFRFRELQRKGAT